MNIESLNNRSVQINNGLTETSADGACMAFDSKYGIMFCAYMPGFQGHYGESRGRICLSYFPASQPTNIRFVTIAEGNDVYCPNILGLGNGKVRIFYESNSRADCDHYYCYRDFDFLSNTVSDEQFVKVRLDNGSIKPLTLSLQFEYLEERGYKNHTYVKTEQVGCSSFFRSNDNYVYGTAVSYLAEPILYRSSDDCSTVEFFAIYPKPAQYEFEYRFLNGIIYILYRTNLDKNSIFFASSADNGKSWSEPIALDESIQCRPRMIVYNSHILICYNYYNNDTQYRPSIQQGRTSVRIRYGENENPNTNKLIADLYSKYGIVNVCLAEIMNDLYFSYSTSECALEYQNGNPIVRGKDAIRYLKLGDLIPKEKR